MIGKHISSPKRHSSFQGLNDYITGKTNRQPEEKIAFTDCLNLASVDTATLEMESLAFQNTRCKDPVMHLLLSWRENETPTIGQAREAVSITLGELNLSQCQAVYSLHQTTDNLHLHICVNRIDPETAKAITPAGGWTRRAMEHAARKIEHAQGWQTEENTWSEIGENGEVIQKPDTSKTRIRQETKDAENQTGEKSAIRKAQEALIDPLENISSWDGRVQVGGGVLKHYRNLGAHLCLLSGRRLRNIHAADFYISLRRFYEFQYHPGKRGLAAAGLANNADYPAPFNGQAHAVHSFYFPGRGEKSALQ